MKRFVTILSLLLLLGSSPSTTAQDMNATAWKEDLQFLWDKIQYVHPDPFRSIPQATFEQMVSDLDTKIPVLTDEQIIVGMLSIVAALRDGHSSIWFQQADYPFQYYPLHFYPFSDGVYLVEAASAYADWVGARLVQIGDSDTAEVTAQLAQLAPRDNESSGLVTIPMMLNLVDVLMGVGIIHDPMQPGYVLERSDGERITLNPTPIAYVEYSADIPVQWRLPQRESPLSLSRVDDAFWWTTLDDDQVIYVQYNQMTTRSSDLTISSLSQVLQTELSGHTVRRLILDMRYNSGGDINTGVPLRSFFADQPLFQQPGGLIILIGRNTFSAGTVFSLWLEQDANPIFIGEPTGGKPLMFENARQFTLPNSHLTFQISTRARHDVDASDIRQAIEPKVAIALSSLDYFAGSDPVLDAALNLKIEAN
jgi:hypothetical protein